MCNRGGLNLEPVQLEKKWPFATASPHLYNKLE